MNLHPVWRDPPRYAREPEPDCPWLVWLGRWCALIAALSALALILR